MDGSFISAAKSIQPLPQPMAAWFEAANAGGAKRERTQSQLVRAAVQVFSSRGVAAASIQEVAQVAGMAAGTVYNHFATKEALIERVAIALARSLCAAIDASAKEVDDAAQRMAIGQRRYLWLAAEAPSWVLVMIDAMGNAPAVMQEIQEYPLADLRLGVKQKRFHVPSEAAAMDAIGGICQAGMVRVALGQAPARHDVAVAAMVLRALGMEAGEALAVAKRPLPGLPLPPAAGAIPLARAPART